MNFRSYNPLIADSLGGLYARVSEQRAQEPFQFLTLPAFLPEGGICQERDRLGNCIRWAAPPEPVAQFVPMGKSAGQPPYVKTLAPTKAAYSPVKKGILSKWPEYVTTLAPTKAAYYPVVEDILAREREPSYRPVSDSPVAKFLCGVALFAGGYLLCKAMHEPSSIGVVKVRKK